MKRKEFWILKTKTHYQTFESEFFANAARKYFKMKKGTVIHCKQVLKRKKK